MLKLIACLMILSTSAFADFSKVTANSQQFLNGAYSEVGQYLEGHEDSACKMVGASKLRASFSKNGRTYKVDFFFKGKKQVDTSVSIDEASSIVAIHNGHLFTSNVMFIKYENKAISEIELVVAVDSALETKISCK